MTGPNAVVVADARAHVDAIIEALRNAAPQTTGVYEAAGPATPANNVPYVVVFPDPGTPGGYPFAPGRDLTMTVSLRGEGLTAEQAQRAAIWARGVLLGDLVAVTGRRVVLNQDEAAATPVERDDSLTPPMFSQLLVFDLRSSPN